MQFKVSRMGKVVKEVTVIAADRFVVQLHSSPSLFKASDGILFYADERGWFTTKETLVAFLPGVDWIVESV